MNNHGQIIGKGSDSLDQFTAAPVPFRSYLVQNGQVTDLGALPNRQETLAVTINDNQQIIGEGGITASLAVICSRPYKRCAKVDGGNAYCRC